MGQVVLKSSVLPNSIPAFHYTNASELLVTLANDSDAYDRLAFILIFTLVSTFARPGIGFFLVLQNRGQQNVWAA